VLEGDQDPQMTGGVSNAEEAKASKAAPKGGKSGKSGKEKEKDSGCAVF